jgi:hypothetical protein
MAHVLKLGAGSDRKTHAPASPSEQKRRWTVAALALGAALSVGTTAYLAAPRLPASAAAEPVRADLAADTAGPASQRARELEDSAVFGFAPSAPAYTKTASGR